MRIQYVGNYLMNYTAGRVELNNFIVFPHSTFYGYYTYLGNVLYAPYVPRTQCGPSRHDTIFFFFSS